jgi:hypothetical protein
MKTFSNSFWLVLWPVIAAYAHLVCLCAVFGIFPGIEISDYPGQDFWIDMLFWPGTLIWWTFGRSAGAVGLVLAFLWVPVIAFWITWRNLKRKNRQTPNHSPADTRA